MRGEGREEGQVGEWINLGPAENLPAQWRAKASGDGGELASWDDVDIVLVTYDELERIPHVAAIIAERDALRDKVRELVSAMAIRTYGETG